jgi:hypothetical protein
VIEILKRNNERVGLLTNYKDECLKMKIMERKKQRASLNQMSGVLKYLTAKWSINIVLSTSHLNKVLKPEILLTFECEGGGKVKMFLKPEKFEELRRQVAYVLRYLQQIECIRYLNYKEY